MLYVFVFINDFSSLLIVSSFKVVLAEIFAYMYQIYR